MSNSIEPQNKPPIAAAFICLILAWGFAWLPVPLISMGGVVVFNIAAFILAIICMSRSSILIGVIVLGGSLTVTPIMYIMGMGYMVEKALSYHEQKRG